MMQEILMMRNETRYIRMGLHRYNDTIDARHTAD